MESDLKPRLVELIRSAGGGMREHYISLIKGLVDSGVEVIALCNFSPKDMELLERLGAVVLRFPINNKTNLIRDISTIIELAKILKKYKVHVLHCHGFRAGLVGRIAAFLACCHCIYTMHNFPPLTLDKRRRRIAGSIELCLSYITRNIITVSEALKKEAIGFMGIKNEKIHVIYNGILRPLGDKSNVDIRKEWCIEDSQVLIGTVARLISSKGIDVLLEAIPLVRVEYPDIRFMIVGDGPEESRLKDQAHKLNCSESIIFTGYMEYIWYCYDVFDIFVLPTLSEGLGISVIEALIAGLPVIASRTGGIEEIIVHKYNGYLVTPNNSKELADAIIYYLSHPEKAMEYARRGRVEIKGRFDEHTMIEKTSDLIFKVIG